MTVLGTSVLLAGTRAHSGPSREQTGRQPPGARRAQPRPWASPSSVLRSPGSAQPCLCSVLAQLSWLRPMRLASGVKGTEAQEAV